MDEPDRKAESRQSAQNVPGGLLGLMAAVLLLGLSKAQGAFGTSQESEAPAVCSAWHRGQGESHPIDLGRMKRSYEDLKARLSRSLTTSLQKELLAVAPKGYDAGLPACRRRDVRRFRPSRQMPGELLGKTLWFTEIKVGTRPTLPDLVRSDPGAVVFALKTDTFEALADASKALGRSVSLASKDLAAALGVRCGPALVSISNEGEVEIHENP
jgi:hypothetical protein